MGLVESFEYKQEFLDNIKRYKYGLDWPVVYIIRDEKEAYVGETTRVYNRSLEHFRNEDRKRLKKIDVITDEDFNKSAISEMETLLIEHMAADGKYKLQNSNKGLSKHNYYKREKYVEKFDSVWNELKEKKIVQRGLFEIKNSDLFKYSPYKSLTTEQSEVVESIIDSIKNNDESKHFISGEPGTGKTIVAIYLLKQLKENPETKDLNVALVVPMTSLRSTLKKVFSSVKDLKSSMVIGPNDVVKKKYDILIVDEAHRLNRRVGIVNMKSFDDTNKKLGIYDLEDGNEPDQLDWIRLSCKHMILCYDKNQSIKPADVRREKFKALNAINHKLSSQMRVIAGEDYIEYIHNILNEKQKEKKEFKGYELFIFDNLEKMHEEIIKKNEEFELCRLISGYSWEWKSKNDLTKDDIIIGNKKLKWNTTNKDWINSENAINEVGCIHTTQGYDLNYAGVILGKEIVYEDNEIKVIKENYFDKNGKNSINNEEELKRYIINIYKTIMTRGIRGTFLYVCDEALRNYLNQYISYFNEDILMRNNISEKDIQENKYKVK